MFVITKSQKQQLSDQLIDRQTDRYVRDAVAAWLAFKPQWESEFQAGHVLELEQIYNIANWLFDWGQSNGFTRQAAYIALTVLVLKAIHLGGDDRYVNRMLATIKSYGDEEEEIEAALIWLDYAVGSRIGLPAKN
jgi:hypothetical protein